MFRSSYAASSFSDDCSLTPKAGVMLTWLAGYRDGIAVLASVDHRFEAVRKTNLDQLGATVLTYCKLKPAMPMVAAATGAFEMLINGLPGAVIDLAVPH
jgi:hypothetical protein